MKRGDRAFLDARWVKDLSSTAAIALVEKGFVAYSEAPAAPAGDLRSVSRTRTRLRSAKLIDADNMFLCEALMHDHSSGGMRLLLARNIGLPPRFGVLDDLSGALHTVSQAWRRGLSVGVRIHASGPPSPMKRGDLAALAGRYYAVRN
jgi:hypothetical protein